MNTLEIKDHYTKFLKNSECVVTFTKVDGEEKTATYTLRDSIIAESWQPKPGSQKTKKPNENVLPVFDINEKSWRSIRLDSIKEFLVLDTYSGIWMDHTLPKEG